MKRAEDWCDRKGCRGEMETDDPLSTPKESSPQKKNAN